MSTILSTAERYRSGCTHTVDRQWYTVTVSSQACINSDLSMYLTGLDQSANDLMQDTSTSSAVTRVSESVNCVSLWHKVGSAGNTVHRSQASRGENIVSQKTVCDKNVFRADILAIHAMLLDGQVEC